MQSVTVSLHAVLAGNQLMVRGRRGHINSSSDLPLLSSNERAMLQVVVANT